MTTQIIISLICMFLCFISAYLHYIDSEKVVFSDKNRARLKNSPNRKKYQYQCAVCDLIMGFDFLVYLLMVVLQIENAMAMIAIAGILILSIFASGRFWKEYIVKNNEKYEAIITPEKVFSSAILILFGVLLNTVCSGQPLIQAPLPNQFALQYRYSPQEDHVDKIPLKIEDGILYEYHGDGKWDEIDLEARAVQVFSGEHLCVLMDNGHLFTDLPSVDEVEQQEENVPLMSGYTLYMAQKALEWNKTTLFDGINQNIESPNFSALVLSGKLLRQGDDDYWLDVLPEETLYMLSGDYVLTEEGNVWYLQGDAIKIYHGGDITQIDASETFSRCVGRRANGEVIVWWQDQTPPDVSEWKNIVEVKQGVTYEVALDRNGRVYYADPDAAKTADVNERLQAWTAVVDVAVASDQIVGLTEDGQCFVLDI